MKTFVYVISGDHGRQKIGSSDNPARRIKELQTGSPFPLRFEFIGETDNRGGGAVEVNAQWMLREHKAIDGGDEWFVVPPDVAITAVMAAASRLGYKLAPRDPESFVAKFNHTGTTYPLWANIGTLPLVALFFYWMVISDRRIDAGDMPLGAFALEAAFLLGGIWLARLLIKITGTQFINLWQDLFAKPQPRESWFKEPQS